MSSTFLRAPRSLGRAAALLSTMLFLASTGGGCAAETTDYPAASAPENTSRVSGSSAASPPSASRRTGTLTGSCPTEGAARRCEAVYGQHAGLQNCFSGEQRCSGGVWTPCLPDPTGGVEPDPTPASAGDEAWIDAPGLSGWAG